MHSVFEGVAQRHLKLLLCYLIDDCHYFNLVQVNHAIKSHPYGNSEADTKPNVINREAKSTDFHIKQSGTYKNQLQITHSN